MISEHVCDFIPVPLSLIRASELDYLAGLFPVEPLKTPVEMCHKCGLIKVAEGHIDLILKSINIEKSESNDQSKS